MSPHMSLPSGAHDRADSGWVQLVTELGKLTFATTYNGNGEYRTNMNCGLCHSIDHPFCTCPFPKTPGWFTPTPIREADNIREDHKALAATECFGRERLVKTHNLSHPPQTGAETSHRVEATHQTADTS